MAVIQISEEEAAKDLKAVLARAISGEEIAIDSSSSSFRLIPSARVKPRTGVEILAILDRLPDVRGIMDDDFAHAVTDFRNRHPESLDGSKWD